MISQQIWSWLKALEESAGSQNIESAIGRVLIGSICILLIGALLHAKGKIALFSGATDALMTIYLPIYALAPLALVELLAYLLNAEWLRGASADSYTLTFGYGLICSLKQGISSNKGNPIGILISSLSRVTASILLVPIAAFVFLMASSDNNEHDNQVIKDYKFARDSALAAALIGGVTLFAKRLSAKKKLSIKQWLTLN